MSFWSKYLEISQTQHSQVCVGLDSEYSKLPACVKSEANPIWSFNKEIIDATKEKVACYKPNFAFYLAAGKAGLEALERTIDYIPNSIPVILDCKVGDIGNTMKSYAKAFFESWAFDAITVNPLMGFDVLEPILDYQDKMAFVLTLTSNPSAEDYFKPQNLYQRIAQDISALPYQQIGAVVGATNDDELAMMRQWLPDTLFLIPGIGAQGGSLEAVCQYAVSNPLDPRILINSSRGIIFKDNSAQFASVAAKETDILREEINRLLSNR